MPRKCLNERQKELFRNISEFENLIFASGVSGISANMSGRFELRSYPEEDRLEVGDGTFHVHIDWSRMKRVEVGTIEMEGRSEGLISFFDGEERLFRLYRQEGAFPDLFQRFNGPLV